MKEEYRLLQNGAVEEWKEKEEMPFSSLIASLPFTHFLYSRCTRKYHFPRLGYYDKLIDFASNVKPIKKVQKEEPRKGFYLQYCFVGETLRLVKYVEDGRSGLSIYIDGEGIYELGPHDELHCYYIIHGNTQKKVLSRGLFVDYIEKMSGTLFRHISCDLFAYTERMMRLWHGVYREKEVVERVVKSKEEIIAFNEEINDPYPFPLSTIEWGYKTLIEAGFEAL